MKLLQKREEFFDAVLGDVDPSIAAKVRSRFLPLMALLEDLNHEARRAAILTNTQMNDIEANIKLFCDLYRATLQTTQATPKLHMLEAHFIEFMRE
mmetsp:Transcript_18971/g.64116  ORF Transcript_18971/g.64116 Transcript_18971/m.64116 type:complete len:96 (-) Transcript_18971:470-757(-)